MYYRDVHLYLDRVLSFTCDGTTERESWSAV
jgi:hypothetical protein